MTRTPWKKDIYIYAMIDGKGGGNEQHQIYVALSYLVDNQCRRHYCSLLGDITRTDDDWDDWLHTLN